MWQELKANTNYQIHSEFPHQIRKVSNQRIVRESIHKSTGYIGLALSKEGKQRYYYKHRLIASQFLGLDLDDKKQEIDHINHIRSDNRLENLRVVSRRENSMNLSGQGGIIYEFVESIPDEALVVKKYGKWKFNDLYFHEDVFYFFNGIRYRKLHINEVKGSGYLYAYAWDTEGKRRQIMYSKFKREYDLIS